MNKAIQFIQKSFYKKEFVNLSLSSISSDGLSQKIKYLILWMKLSDDVFVKKKKKKSSWRHLLNGKHTWHVMIV